MGSARREHILLGLNPEEREVPGKGPDRLGFRFEQTWLPTPRTSTKAGKVPELPSRVAHRFTTDIEGLYESRSAVTGGLLNTVAINRREAKWCLSDLSRPP